MASIEANGGIRTGVRMWAEEYKIIEITPSKENELFSDPVVRGTVKAEVEPTKANKNVRSYYERTGTFTKVCMANLIKGMVEATTIVNIPDVDRKGRDISGDLWNQMHVQAEIRYGVSTNSSSSIQGHTFYFIEPDFATRLAKGWNLEKDGYRFAVRIGLLYSEMTKEELLLVNTPELWGEKEENDGVDGNCTVDKKLWGRLSMQFRGLGLPDNIDIEEVLSLLRMHQPIVEPEDINALSKGMGAPFNGIDGMQLNTSQVKWGSGGIEIILRNKSINGGERGRLPRMYVSAELVLCLRNNRATRRFAQRGVKREVGHLVNLLNTENQDKLNRRLGFYRFNAHTEDFHPARRAVEEGSRVLPMCDQLEGKLDRFMTRTITQKIIPSAGMFGHKAPIIISDKHGAGLWKPNPDNPRAEPAAYIERLPNNGSDAVVPLDKNPYVQGIGYVVTAEVAKMLSGDADGDVALVILNKRIIRFIKKNLNKKLNGGMKTVKHRIDSPLTWENLGYIARDLVEKGWLVGGATNNSWKLIESGLFDIASIFLMIANLAPMLSKWIVRVKGEDLIDYAESLQLKYKKYLQSPIEKKLRKAWKDNASEEHLIELINMLPWLRWRWMMRISERWNSVREIAGKKITNPRTLGDYCWNSAESYVGVWSRHHPRVHLPLGMEARKRFGANGLIIPGKAYREAREQFIEYYGEYWSEWYGVKGKDHSQFYTELRNRALACSDEVIAAVLEWMPQSNSDGMGLKWPVAFETGRAHNVMDYNEVTQAELEAQRASIRRKKSVAQHNAIKGESISSPMIVFN